MFKCKPLINFLWYIFNKKKITYVDFSPLNTIAQHKFIKSFNKPTGHGNKLNFIQINQEICEKINAELSAFSNIRDPEWKSK